MTPQLSIVIVNFNGGRHLDDCLASLAAYSPAIPHEIVVVDNASTDDSLAAARGRPGVRVIALPRNSGFSAANNVGISATTGPLVLLLNNDTLVGAGALDALVSKLESDAQAGIAGPRLVDDAGRAELSFGPMMSPLAEMRQKIMMSLHQRGVAAVTRRVERATRTEQYVDWVSGACLLVRREVADAVGLLDERFFLYTEDVDFCASVRARGWRVLFTPDAEIIHLRGRSRATVSDAANDAYRRSHLAFYAKHHPRWFPLLRAYLRIKGALPPLSTPNSQPPTSKGR
jgi:GT2 family glycosyltransferase